MIAVLPRRLSATAAGSAILALVGAGSSVALLWLGNVALGWAMLAIATAGRARLVSARRAASRSGKPAWQVPAATSPGGGCKNNLQRKE